VGGSSSPIYLRYLSSDEALITTTAMTATAIMTQTRTLTCRGIDLTGLGLPTKFARVILAKPLAKAAAYFAASWPARALAISNCKSFSSVAPVATWSPTTKPGVPVM
jgi:hypothetical protein